MTNIKAQRGSLGLRERCNRSLKASDIAADLFDAFSVGTFLIAYPAILAGL